MSKLDEYRAALSELNQMKALQHQMAANPVGLRMERLSIHVGQEGYASCHAKYLRSVMGREAVRLYSAAVAEAERTAEDLRRDAEIEAYNLLAGDVGGDA